MRKLGTCVGWQGSTGGKEFAVTVLLDSGEQYTFWHLTDKELAALYEDGRVALEIAPAGQGERDR